MLAPTWRSLKQQLWHMCGRGLTETSSVLILLFLRRRGASISAGSGTLLLPSSRHRQAEGKLGILENRWDDTCFCLRSVCSDITSTLFSIQHALTEAWELAHMREIIHRLKRWGIAEGLKGNKLPETFSTLLSHVKVIPDTFLKGGVKQIRDNEEIRKTGQKDDFNPE